MVRFTTSRSKAPTRPRSSLVCTHASATRTTTGPLDPAANRTRHHRDAGCDRAQSSARRHGGQRLPADAGSSMSRTSVLHGTSST